MRLFFEPTFGPGFLRTGCEEATTVLLLGDLLLGGRPRGRLTGSSTGDDKGVAFFGGRPRGRFRGEGGVVVAAVLLLGDLILGGRPRGRLGGDTSLRGDVGAGDFGGGVFSRSIVVDDLVLVVGVFGDVDNLLVDTLASAVGAALHGGHNHLRTGIELNAGLRQNM